MADSFFDRVYGSKNNTHTPDILSCLANLSNDEVFTPPEVANKMLDMLPQELFRDPNTKFLDPACKTGVFLREIAKRLLVGLEPIYPNLQERIDHIFHNQLFGIAITELTSLLSRRSLYCSKYPNGPYSISKFDNPQGGIRFKKTQHTWESNQCKYCGASKQQWERNNELETHAYEFIHNIKNEELLNMKFDVIIANPPYQLNDGGGTGMSAKPIYQYFVYQAKKMEPRFISMIIPSRWFTGGKGLDEFRASMLSDKRIKKLVDYDNFKEVFPGVDLAGGACYFLWDRAYNGPCEVVNISGDKTNTLIRNLDENSIFIRSNEALNIVKKVQKLHKGEYLNSVVSTRLPFGIPTTYKPVQDGIPCWFNQKQGLQNVRKWDVCDGNNYLNKWKLLIPKAPIAGQTDFSKPVGFYYDGNIRIAKPGEVCSESWLVAYACNTKEEIEYFKSYLLTKTVRFLLLQTVVSQNTTRNNFCFVPHLGKYDYSYDDEYLRQLWKISDSEWKYIQSRIKNIGEEGE